MANNSPYYIEHRGSDLCLIYELPQDIDWVKKRFDEYEEYGDLDKSITLKKVFDVTRNDVVDKYFEKKDNNPLTDSYFYVFKIGELISDYFKITKITGVSNAIYLHKDIKITIETFLFSGKISVFHILDGMVQHDIYISGEKEGAIPNDEFNKLFKEFPNDYEITKYKMARMSAVVKDYLQLKRDYQAEYEKYLNNKSRVQPPEFVETVKDNEIAKYHLIKSNLEKLLADDTISEKQWQQEILEFILLLFPKYVKVIRELPIKDSFSGKTRYVDFALIDTSGYIDIIEIKKPDSQSIVTSGTYRDNHVPMRELSGAIMQVEKYILNLNKWGEHGEKFLNDKYINDLPSDLTIKVINPTGLVIMGRTNNLSAQQQGDFEIVRRKYKNVVDIITYDDLLQRLDTVIEQLSKNQIFT